MDASLLQVPTLATLSYIHIFTTIYQIIIIKELTNSSTSRDRLLQLYCIIILANGLAKVINLSTTHADWVGSRVSSNAQYFPAVL